METEGIFSRACRTANTIASLAATATTTSSPTTGTISVPIKTATDRASGTLHRSNRPIEAEALITSTRACGTASTIVSMVATAGITSNPTARTTSAPTETATNTDIATSAYGITSSLHTAG